MVFSNRTNLFLRVAAVLVVVSAAFAPSSLVPKTHPTVLTQISLTGNANENHKHHRKNNQEDAFSGRREFFQQLATASASAALLLSSRPESARAGLLDEFGTDPSKIVVPEEKKVEVLPVAKAPKGEVAIDPTLRASYYYPTAKKRYLPRIQKVTANIDQVPQFIANGQWEQVQEFSASAENAILPLQLYVSSLDGQGLSMSNGYAKVMKKDALIYEEQYKLLQKALKKKDQDLALSAVQQMGIAVADYRQQGRLKDDDGNIPSVDEIKRSTMRRTTQAQFALNQ